MSASRSGMILALVAAFACGSERDNPGPASGMLPAATQQNNTPAPGSSQPAQMGANLPVGSPCTLKDGYVPQFPACPATGANGTPMSCPPPDRQTNPGFSDLPPGIGYCLTSQQFPHGYFTMNCAQNSDCPNGSLCDGVCWKPCTSDDECSKPTTCLKPPATPHTRFVRYCTCLDCIPSDPL
jgi:hypothetical protein